MKDLSTLLAEEKKLQFDHFSLRTAWDLGRLAAEKAYREKLPIAINIDRYGQTLFHSALPGTSPDNDDWIAGKKRVVYHFLHSSFYMSRYYIKSRKSLENDSFLNPAEYRMKGGAFPLLLKDSGLIAVLTISGLKDHEDHDFAVAVLKEFLNAKMQVET